MKRSLIALTLAILLSGCDNSEELVFDNFDTVSAVRCRNERFGQLLLGSPARPYSGTPAITLRTPELGEIHINGRVEGRLSEFYEKAEKFDASRTVCVGGHPGRGPRSGTEFWGSGSRWATLLKAESVSIELVVRDGKILGLAIFGASPHVEVKTEGSDWHAFPLSKEALSDLFGAPKDSYQWMAE
jgi:hypothetical protein